MEGYHLYHLLTLASQACPGTNYRGQELADIIITGYARELSRDIAMLYQLPVAPEPPHWKKLIDDYCRCYERYLHQWLLLQSEQEGGNAQRFGEQSQNKTTHDSAEGKFLEWRSWRGIRLYQLKKYCLLLPRAEYPIYTATPKRN